MNRNIFGRRVLQLAFLSAFVVGCTQPPPPPKPVPQPVKVSGQVFIATEGGLSYKLALVKVYAMDESEILQATHASIPLIQADADNEKSRHDGYQSSITKDNSTITELSEAIENERTKLVETQVLHDDSQAKIKTLVAKSLHDMDEVTSKMTEFQNTDASMQNTQKVQLEQLQSRVEELKKSSADEDNEVGTLGNVVKSTEKDIANLANDLKSKSEALATTQDDLKKQEGGAKADQAQFDQSNNRGVQFTKLLKIDDALAEADTDADGHFDIIVAPGHKFYLVANAHRKVPDGIEEYYFWILPVEEDNKVSLNNSNLTTSADIASRFGSK